MIPFLAPQPVTSFYQWIMWIWWPKAVAEYWKWPCKSSSQILLNLCLKNMLGLSVCSPWDGRSLADFLKYVWSCHLLMVHSTAHRSTKERKWGRKAVELRWEGRRNGELKGKSKKEEGVLSLMLNSDQTVTFIWVVSVNSCSFITWDGKNTNRRERDFTGSVILDFSEMFHRYCAVETIYFHWKKYWSL